MEEIVCKEGRAGRESAKISMKGSLLALWRASSGDKARGFFVPSRGHDNWLSFLANFANDAL